MARILIVDWDEYERVALWSVLEDAGHQLFFASDGEAALAIWEKVVIEVVITELAMPRMNGLRLIRELVERDPGARIVAISAVSADQLDLAENFGACAILYKPVEPEELVAAVGRALEGYRPRGKDDWR